MKTILVWLGSGFAFALGLVTGIGLVKFTSWQARFERISLRASWLSAIGHLSSIAKSFRLMASSLDSLSTDGAEVRRHYEALAKHIMGKEYR